jgi:hypothetical protein
MLWLKPTEVYFMVGTQKVFTGAPSEVLIKRQTNHTAQGHVSLTLEVNRKNYQLDFISFGVECEFSAFVNCSADGSARQTAIGNYVAATIPKLASGEFGK